MSRPPGATPPPSPPDPSAPEPRVRVVRPKDEVAAAKARLLETTEKVEMASPQHKISDFLRDHPYLAAGAALGAGLAVAKVALLRKLAVAGGVWAAKRYAARYFGRMGR